MNLNKKNIRLAIDKGEETFLRCWEILRRIRAAEVDREELLDFQPALFVALFKLDSLYHYLALEKRTLVSRKEKLNSAWFRKRMAALSYYQRLISEASKRGRLLGNTFAWLFYHREEEHLHKHLKRPYNPRIFPGIGGQVEVEFANRYRLLAGRFFLLHHGTTTFLRIGDVSFIDVESLSLAGIGELKAGPVEGAEVSVQLTVLGSSSLELMAQSAVPQSGATLQEKGTQRYRDRFRRQLDTMKQALDQGSRPDVIDLRLLVSHGVLDGLADEAISDRISFRQIGPSLAVQATYVGSRPSLFLRLTRPVTKRVLDEFLGRMKPEHLLPLVLEGSEDNALWIGRLSPHYMPGATPLFWTDVDSNLMDYIFKDEVAVTTFYNPARFIQQLRGQGFEVSLVKGRAELEISTVVEDRRIVLRDNRYYLNLIQAHLVDEAAVANSLRIIIDNIDFDAISGDGLIELLPVQFYEEEGPDGPLGCTDPVSTNI